MSTTVARPDVAAEQGATLDAITALPDDFRASLVAVDIVGLSYAEAASALGTREATITSRLSRARRRVARAVADDSTGKDRVPAGSFRSRD